MIIKQSPRCPLFTTPCLPLKRREKSGFFISLLSLKMEDSRKFRFPGFLLSFGRVQMLQSTKFRGKGRHGAALLSYLLRSMKFPVTGSR